MYTLEKTLKKENKFLKYAFMLLKSVVFSIVLTIIIAIIIGFRPVIVVSGSMSPTLKINDIIIIYKPAQEDIKVGDILTYSSGEAYTTHRIISIDEDGCYSTKGDHISNSPDNNKVYYNQADGTPYVVGITYYSLHYIGQFVAWIRIIPNLVALIASIYLLFQLSALIKEFFKKYSDAI